MSVKTPSLVGGGSGFWRKHAQGKAGNSKPCSLVKKQIQTLSLGLLHSPWGTRLLCAVCVSMRSLQRGFLPGPPRIRFVGGGQQERGPSPLSLRRDQPNSQGPWPCGSALCQLCNLGKLLNCSGPRLKSKMGILLSEELNCGVSESVRMLSTVSPSKWLVSRFPLAFCRALLNVRRGWETGRAYT